MKGSHVSITSKKAVKQLQELSRTYPRNHELLPMLVECYENDCYVEAHLEEDLRYYTALEKEWPPNVYYIIGLIYALLKNYQATAPILYWTAKSYSKPNAAAYLTKLAEENPANSILTYYRARLEKKPWKEATGALLKSIEPSTDEEGPQAKLQKELKQPLSARQKTPPMPPAKSQEAVKQYHRKQHSKQSRPPCSFKSFRSPY